MTQCFTNLIKIQLTSFKSVKKPFCINLLDSCFSWFWWTVVELCVGEHIIIALFTFSLNLFLEQEALTLKICKMLKIMLVLLQKNVNMNDVKPQKFKPRSLIYLNLTKHPDPSGHRETSTLYSRLKTEKGEARASWTPEVCWNWSLQLPWVWMVLYRYTCLSGSFVNHSHRHVYCLHRYSTLRTEWVACFRCV